MCRCLLPKQAYLRGGGAVSTTLQLCLVHRNCPHSLTPYKTRSLHLSTARRPPRRTAAHSPDTFPVHGTPGSAPSSLGVLEWVPAPQGSSRPLFPHCLSLGVFELCVHLTSPPPDTILSVPYPQPRKGLPQGAEQLEVSSGAGAQPLKRGSPFALPLSGQSPHF